MAIRKKEVDSWDQVVAKWMAVCLGWPKGDIGGPKQLLKPVLPPSRHAVVRAAKKTDESEVVDRRR